MVLGGIGGGIIGRRINRKIDNATVDALFLVLMGVILLISLYNAYRVINV